MSTRTKYAAVMHGSRRQCRGAVPVHSLKRAIRIHPKEKDADLCAAQSLTSQDIFKDPFAHFSIHSDWLKDSQLILGYRQAILDNRHLFRGKIVLDVNCGVGLLSLFAIRAGAKHVYAIDQSKSTHLAQLIVRDNNYTNSITVIHGDANSIKLPVDHVDIILSFVHCDYRHYEISLGAIIDARNKWLKPNGLMFPDVCHINMAAIHDHEMQRSVNFWGDVYGFDMNTIQRDFIASPITANIRPEAVITNEFRLKTFDFYKVSKADMERFDVVFRLDAIKTGNVLGLITYFQLDFKQSHLPFSISMSPWLGINSWKPRAFFWSSPLILSVNATDEIYGVFRTVSKTSGRHEQWFKILVCCNDRSINEIIRREFQYRLK